MRAWAVVALISAVACGGESTVSKAPPPTAPTEAPAAPPRARPPELAYLTLKVLGMT